MVLALLLGLAACGTDTTPQASYKPEFLPIKLSIDPNGISISGDKSIVTPIGVFSVGAKYSLPDHGRDTIYVIIRDRKKDRIGYDTVYQVRTGGGDSFSAVVNGTTSIHVTNSQVIIDVTDGTVREIQFKRSTQTISEGNNDNLASRGVDKWNQGYRKSWYKPFTLSRWAYDDSTIDKWFGLGFIWFLLRLVGAIILGILDLILTTVFVVAQILYLFAGSTGYNIAWGVFVLVIILVVAGGFTAARA